ncbi:MAG: pyridoxal phosphate-dependent aminotransferase [Proteobacteria bacterium]|nr:pyridoxal phosphate-dependent aminotransferase [Burkholderiales bacterium]
MPYSPSKRAEAVQSPIIPVIAQAIREHPGTLSLGQGVVYYPPPTAVFDAIDALAREPELNKYQAVHGADALIAAITTKLAHDNAIVPGTEQRIVVTAGGNMAFLNVVLAVCDPGDEVILPLPYYFNQEMAITLASATPVGVPTAADYQLDVEAIARAITPRTRAVVTVSPNNPTGAVYSRASLAAVNALCLERGLYHVSDEAYEYFVHEGDASFSPGSLPDAGRHTISLYSLSKAYGFASWRVGYMVIPVHLYPAIAKIQDTNLICPPMVSQLAAVVALAAGAQWCAPRIAALTAVREAVLAALQPLEPRVTVPRTRGAFYCLLRVADGGDSLALARRMIASHRVAVIPGVAFGVDEPCLLRVSYGALDRASVETAVGRLVSALRT